MQTSNQQSLCVHEYDTMTKYNVTVRCIMLLVDMKPQAAQRQRSKPSVKQAILQAALGGAVGSTVGSTDAAQ